MAELTSLYPLIFLTEGVFALVIAFLILSKNPRFYLNRIFALILASFFVYFLFESLIYFFHEDMMVANLFKDVSITGSFTSSYLFFLAGWFLVEGTTAVRKKLVLGMTFLWLFALLFSILDEYVMPITTEVEFGRTAGLGHLITYGLPLVLIVWGSFLIYSIIGEVDEATKTKLSLLLAGTYIIVLGIVYFATFRFTGIQDWLGSVADLIGAILYSGGMLLLFYAFWREPSSTQASGKEEEEG